MDASARHQHYIQNYVLYYGGQQALARANATAKAQTHCQTEADVIRRNHQFLRHDTDDSAPRGPLDPHLLNLTPAQRWEAQLARAYYDRLYKEYALVDLSRYKDGQIALRWRVEREVLDGKGQLVCGNVACSKAKRLQSWEVPFKYRELGEDKRALVKVRVCRKCEKKLHYKRDKDRKADRRRPPSNRDHDGDGDASASGSSDEEQEEEDDQEALRRPPRQRGDRGHRSRHDERARSPAAAAASSASRVARDRDRPAPSSRAQAAPSQADLDLAFAGLFD